VFVDIAGMVIRLNDTYIKTRCYEMIIGFVSSGRLSSFSLWNGLMKRFREQLMALINHYECQSCERNNRYLIMSNELRQEGIVIYITL